MSNVLIQPAATRNESTKTLYDRRLVRRRTNGRGVRSRGDSFLAAALHDDQLRMQRSGALQRLEDRDQFFGTSAERIESSSEVGHRD